jgi:hypothetical protein
MSHSFGLIVKISPGLRCVTKASEACPLIVNPPTLIKARAAPSVGAIFNNKAKCCGSSNRAWLNFCTKFAEPQNLLDPL